MKRLLAAFSFLTRWPVTFDSVLEAKDIGRASIFFPLVGALIGLIQTCVLLLFSHTVQGNSFKAGLVAALLVVVNIFVTGALHLDGLADMADGFGGGRSKERTLEIMRDSLIGSFGAVALILLIIIKTTAIASLIKSENAWRFLILAPTLGRWTTVPLGKFLPYARKSGGLGQSMTDFVDWKELIGATVLSAILLFGLLDWREAAVLCLIVIILTFINARLCLKKIGGLTGDTLGANTEICETATLFAAAFLS